MHALPIRVRTVNRVDIFLCVFAFLAIAAFLTFYVVAVIL